MFKFIRRRMTAAVVKSYMKRFLIIDSLYKTGKYTEAKYQLEKEKVIFEYQDYLRSTPREFIPDYAKDMD